MKTSQAAASTMMAGAVDVVGEQGQQRLEEDMAESSHQDASSSMAQNKSAAERKRDEIAEVEKLAQQESWKVAAWREVILVFMFMAAVMVTALTHVYLTIQDEKDFHRSLEGLKRTLEDSARFHVRGMADAVQGLSRSYTSYVMEQQNMTNTTNASWPFVTLPGFEVYAEHNRPPAIELVAFLPLVRPDQLDAWSEYSLLHQNWIQDAADVVAASAVSEQKQRREQMSYNSSLSATTTATSSIPSQVYRWQMNATSNKLQMVPEVNVSALPFWQMSPPPAPATTANSTMAVNFNALSDVAFRQLYDTVVRTKSFAEGPVAKSSLLKLGLPLASTTTENHSPAGVTTPAAAKATNYHQQVLNATRLHDLHLPYRFRKNMPRNDSGDPWAMMTYPVFDRLNAKNVTNSAQNGTIVGMVLAAFSWDTFLLKSLPPSVEGMFIVLSSNCGNGTTAIKYTYLIEGGIPVYLGIGAKNQKDYENMKTLLTFPTLLELSGMQYTSKDCRFNMTIVPSNQMRMDFKSNTPRIFAGIVAVTFLFMLFTFCMYDGFVERKDQKIIQAAARSNAVVSSLFPSTVRDRLFHADDDEDPQRGKKSQDYSQRNKKKNKKIKNGASDFERDLDENEEMVSGVFTTQPIADLFPNTTIMFADLVGFTAWSSVREPVQVFILLETVYRTFDKIAKRRRVFKVETVGDCYVAASGLPDPRKDHAIVMARFALACLEAVQPLMKELEVALGPDTGDLTIRVGLHSGAVTAGVLRGERSRFQLFGDTMNTASRMETTGQQGRIQLSQDTADLLIAAGKKHWLKKREDRVMAKGKGEMQTYWLDVRSENSSTGGGSSDKSMTSSTHSTASSSGGESPDKKSMDPVTQKEVDDELTLMQTGKTKRLIAWNVDVLARLLKQVIARRETMDHPESSREDYLKLLNEYASSSNTDCDKRVLDEVQEIITLPQFCHETSHNQRDPESLELEPAVVAQLQRFVETIASMYRDNPFHNFEHASHVTMSVMKLMSRIVAPSDLDVGRTGRERTASTLHDHTYGITSDPLTQFACAFSALIHDVDHTGVPNTILVSENTEIAKFYKNKSVAEQNSVDLSWGLLMDDCYADLRAAMFHSDEDLRRFRQLIVNAVMATDIMDKDLKALRNARWEKAFAEASAGANERDAINRKATIVIEHMIQASDVAHTMQHWHVYRKWNERFFHEMYRAYKNGRSDTDPATFWYKGEMGFFDFYIIPLARKLKDCGVFGVSSDEYLNYAKKNRQEWETRGQEVVAEMVAKVTFR